MFRFIRGFGVASKVWKRGISTISCRREIDSGLESFTHVYLLSKVQSRYEATQRNVRKELRSAGFSAKMVKA